MMIKYSFLKCKWKIIVIMILSIYSIAYFVLNFGTDILDVSTSKCPACYGNNVCHILQSSSYALLFPSNLKLFNQFFNVKNVFYIELHNIKYVAKQLAHDEELLQFDKNLCKAAKLKQNCNESEAIIKLYLKYNNLFQLVNGEDNLFDKTDCIKCNQQSTLDFLYSQFTKLDSSSYAMHHFTTLLAINPEPLIIQAQFNDLPLPTIYGMCGRHLVETYEGKRLTQFYNADWVDRAYLGLQLLRIAVDSSENNWKLFLLDVSPNNFAVDLSLTVRLIDVENVLILDSTANGLSGTPYQNDGKGCPDCLSFSYEDLCSHKVNDHNYFAICKGLLAPSSFSNNMPDGLLHSIPEDFITSYSNFESILHECASPTGMGRKVAAYLLIDMLKNIVPPKGDS